MSERTYRAKVSKELRMLGCVVTPLIGTAAGGSGWPDCRVSSRTISYWIEFKGVNTKHKDIQKFIGRKLLKVREAVYVLREPGLLQDMEGNTICPVESGSELQQIIRERHPELIKGDRR